MQPSSSLPDYPDTEPESPASDSINTLEPLSAPDPQGEFSTDPGTDGPQGEEEKHELECDLDEGDEEDEYDDDEEDGEEDVLVSWCCCWCGPIQPWGAGCRGGECGHGYCARCVVREYVLSGG